MPASLTVDHYLLALAAAGGRLVDAVEQAGLDAGVPTCPGWDAGALLAHQAMVHRWAAANVRGEDPSGLPTDTELRGLDALPRHYRKGLAQLIDALGAAPDNLEAMTFLNDAPAPRRFWARRQAHETTIHMVDALAARDGGPPDVEAVDLEADLAADGIDELLRGFFTRGRAKLFDGDEYTVAVVAADVDRRWLVRVAERLTVSDDGADADATVTGTAAQLYLALWNRGDEIDRAEPPDVLDRWRAAQRVRWD